jgi:competence protein ComGC
MKDKLLNQKGVTLVELVVAMGIAVFIVVAAATVIFQLDTVSARNSNYMTAYTEVQNAGFSISRDTTMAQDVDVTSGLVTLNWVDWEGDAHEVVYTLEDASGGLKELWRTYSISDVTQETMRVARYIDPVTNCTWDEGEKVLTLVITAQVGDQTATRTYNVEPRPLS